MMTMMMHQYNIARLTVMDYLINPAAFDWWEKRGERRSGRFSFPSDGNIDDDRRILDQMWIV